VLCFGPMGLPFDDAVADLLDSLDQLSVRAALLESVLRQSSYAVTGANLRADCARAMVAAKKIAHLSHPVHRPIQSGPRVYLIHSRD